MLGLDEAIAPDRFVVQERVLPGDVGRHPGGDRAPVAGERLDTTAEHVDLGVALEPLRLQREPGRVRHVVGVHPRDERRARLGERAG